MMERRTVKNAKFQTAPLMEQIFLLNSLS